MPEESPLDIPINGVLDLHTFQPKDVKGLVPDYIAECREQGILQVRIIHGKGTGSLRERLNIFRDRFGIGEQLRHQVRTRAQLKSQSPRNRTPATSEL